MLGDLHAICDKIDAGHSWCARRDAEVETHIVRWDGVGVVVVYQRDRRTIRTFLPPEVIHSGARRRKATTGR